MGILSESLSEEHLIAGTHYSTIIKIDIIYKQPCADAVICKCASLLGQLHDILIEEQSHCTQSWLPGYEPKH